MKQLRNLFQSFSILVTLTLLLFLGVNAVAYVGLARLKKAGPGVSVAEWFVTPSSPRGRAILKQVFQKEDENWLIALAEGDPGIRSHTVLPFTQGHSRPHYTIGLEGMRYEPGWTDEGVRSALAEPGEHTYLFGGSTAFGHGVPDDQTLAAYLNRSAEDRHFNLAVQAYDSIREVDKLLYMLRKGYRPRRVLFLDGLNDVTTFAWSPYLAQDKPRTQGLLIDRGQVPLIFGYPMRKNMLSALVFSFPVVQLFQRLNAPSIDQLTHEARDANVDDLLWDELMLYYQNWDQIQVGRSVILAEELVDYYRKNIAFVTRLGDAFGFKAYFVYQPIGLLEERHPFLLPEFEGTAVRSIYQTVDHRIRQAIAEGELEMIDCSKAIAAAGVEDGYVDAAHYSPQGNAALARCILDGMAAKSAR